MKTSLKIIIVSLLLTNFFLNSSNGQTYYYNFGYNAGFPRGLDSLNFVIDRYNQTRTYLTEPMEHFTYLDGFHFTGGYSWSIMCMEIGYTAGIQRRYAEGVDISQQLIRRELKLSTHTFDMGLGLAILDADKGAILLGVNANLGFFTIRTRSGEAENIRKVDWEKINPYDNDIFTYGFFIKFIISNPGFYIQPYIQLSPKIAFTNDMYDVNRALNPNTYENDPSSLLVNSSVIGIKFGFAFMTELRD